MYTRSILYKKIKKSNLIFLAVLVFLLCFSFIYFKIAENRYRSVISFDTCLQAGFKAVQGIYPEECRIPGKRYINPRQEPLLSEGASPVVIPVLDYKNLTYLLDGESFYLTDGVGTLGGDMASRRSTTTLHVAPGKEFLFDINADVVPDTIFILQGTTTQGLPVAYLTAAVSLNNGFSGVNMVPLALSLSSGSIVYKNGGISITYTSASSSKVVSGFFVFENGIIRESNAN